MGHQLRTYNGAVLFIDILGFGALTNNQIPLSDEDMDAWLHGSPHNHNHQFLAATLLVEFRSLLQRLQLQFPDVKIAQLSDCFFAWSPQIEYVVKFAHTYMIEAIKIGLLSRGGMAQGQIIETERNHSLGRLILGQAVTTAVALEKPCKGARILIDVDLSIKLYEENQAFHTTMYEMFQPFESPLDYQVYDEFQWYLTDRLDDLPDYGIRQCSPEDKLSFTKHRLKLVNHLIFDPKFGWNARTSQGKIHLQATANFLSRSGLNKVKHEFDRRGFSEHRTPTMLSNAHKRIDQDLGYIVLR
ncbi:hypothetical protein GCM10023149_53190 [Mucilaginibacter gynuensis]|uniref:Guanylate cyclase domain-containing protein n=1 Tax=Mucilaginibacter gynuensis TaxID=1302236 RepID=A0ABP8HLW2_9SPHI